LHIYVLALAFDGNYSSISSLENGSSSVGQVNIDVPESSDPANPCTMGTRIVQDHSEGN